MPAELPLLEYAGEHCFSLLVKDSPLIPARPPAPGEQYRFHFDMTRCIGCKCCVVACNEQNGNPSHINWRRVGEVEGGVYPAVARWHLSMGCNHCVEPSCMIGCPVNAYTKDALTGIVDHSADICIGCQYCTWNCSYGVPQFNEARGVVGKCDMCHGRLAQGNAPACVNACPEEAIAIEIVNIAEWRRQHDSADAPGLPSAEDSLSTTRITVPVGLDAALSRVDTLRVQPEHPHWSLVLLLVATQLSVGSFLALFLTQLLGGAPSPFAALLPLLIGLTAIGAAPVHLGRPAFAYRAIFNWKRSWLSREILALSLFAGAAVAYAAVLFFQLPYGTYAGAAALLTGLVGVTSSARIYMVKARPAWNLPHTLLSFHLTALLLGARLVPVPGLAACASLLQVAVALAKEKHMAASQAFELTASAELLNQQLGRQYRLYLLLSFVAVALLPYSAVASLAVALGAEIAGRWLFFTSVVPKNVASTFLTPKGAAA